MKIRYMIYQIQCAVSHKPSVDYVEWLSTMLFMRGAKI